MGVTLTGKLPYEMLWSKWNNGRVLSEYFSFPQPIITSPLFPINPFLPAPSGASTFTCI